MCWISFSIGAVVGTVIGVAAMCIVFSGREKVKDLIPPGL